MEGNERTGRALTNMINANGGYFLFNKSIARAVGTLAAALMRETRTGIMDGICCPRFRVIDEVGRYPDSKTEQFVLYDISNRCYETYGSSIYVTNLSRHETGNFLGGAVIDRFRGIGMTIEFCGKSYRGTEKELYTR